jgi:3D (Asp-Asp-Asp) domain-containing protein
MDSNKRLGLLPQGRMALILFGAITLLSFTPILTVFAPSSLAEAQADFTIPQNGQNPIIQTPSIQENSFLASASHYPPSSSFTIIETIPVTVTAYSSSVWETDDTPFITASGTQTRDGIVASNLLPFGTKIMIPEYFGSKVFIVEDRMNERIGDFTIDIWFPSHLQAEQFGVKYTYIETVR